jgi:hypothetical protein
MLIRAEPMQTQEKRTKSHKASRVVGKKGDSRMMRDDSKDEDDDDRTDPSAKVDFSEKQTRPQPSLSSGIQPMASRECHSCLDPMLSFFRSYAISV